MLRIASGTAAGPKNGAARFQRASACTLCDGHDVELLATRDRRGNPLSTVVCIDCGLISHQDIPTDTEVSKYYSQEYRKDYHGEHLPSAKRVVNAWNRGQRLLSDLGGFLQPGSRVFEVGAGIGCSVKVFELAGYDASGIEPGDGFGHYSRDVLRSPVRQGLLEDVPRDSDCDLVLLVHVIEHFNDPCRALNQIHDLLKPGGRFYVECPNVGAPHAAPGKLFHYAHIYNFTHTTLRMLARKCGFRVAEQFSSESEGNIRMVLERGVAEPPVIDLDSYRASLAAVNRYSTITYHARPSYLAGRVRTISVRTAERLLAKRRLRDVVEACQEPAAA